MMCRLSLEGVVCYAVTGSEFNPLAHMLKAKDDGLCL